MQDRHPVGSFMYPAPSCKDIPPSSPSGHYWIQSTSTGYATSEYCHMSPPCSCNAVPGWMRVAHLNMTDPNGRCPDGLTDRTEKGKSFCNRIENGCSSVPFPVHGVRYSKVCGKIIGYQYHQPNAFGPYVNFNLTIDEGYLDGLSLTRGQSPRSHIWSFANAIDETRSDRSVCPCTNTGSHYTGIVPPFIGTDYFCATGSRDAATDQWYTDDPLWDGEGCGKNNACCRFNSPPWFCKDLPESTTDDIELRVCHNHQEPEENFGVEIVDIFIQ